MSARTESRMVRFGIIAVLACANGIQAGEPAEELFPSFADRHTAALWLFDETEYPHTTLTDAGSNEYDLRLQDGGRLVPGKFGNALQVSNGAGYAVSYAGFAGDVPGGPMRGRNGEPSGLWGPTIVPGRIVNALASGDWTLELWLKLPSGAAKEVTIIDLGYARGPGIIFNLAAGAQYFRIVNAYAGVAAACATDGDRLTDGKWHHICFTGSGAAGGIGHFLDGKFLGDARLTSFPKVPVPEVIVPDDLENDSFGFTAKKDNEWRRNHRFNISIGHDRQGKKHLGGMIDELRISEIIRYRQDFGLPESFSRNYGPNAPQPAVADGPPLLFGADSPESPVELGSRKHLFIDDALIENMENIKITCNPPTDRQDLNFRPDSSNWRATVFDKDNKVYMFIPDGYGSAKGMTRLRISQDGINFTRPKLGIFEYKGSTDNDFVFLGTPFYGTVFNDLNPNIGPEERFKLTAWVANRGIYLYLSPDGIHWRRNETCMLPLASGGGAETYWDDQRGVYVDFIKRDSSYKNEGCPGGGRRAVMFETREIFKTWPFEPRTNPYFESWPFPAVTCEGPVIFAPDKNGQVYRTRAIKYPWAPDTYLAFVWRFDKQDQHRQVDLGVSRDGISWKFFADESWYLTPGADEEVLSLYGLIRRGDEIWQYFDYGGAHGGSRRRTYARLTQRLDGFVSLTAGEERGTVITRPLVFEGSKLTLNAAARGAVRVAIMNEAGRGIRDYTLSECDPVQTDSTNLVVSWKTNSDVGGLAGKVVRLKFEMRDAQLYAIWFD